MIPRENRMGPDGQIPEMTLALREMLGQLAGPPPPPTTGVQVLPDLTGGIAPIKIGAKKKKKEEPMMIELSARNVLEEEEVAEEKDTQLVSRSELIYERANVSERDKYCPPSAREEGKAAIYES
jgi:hypothetical protein